MVALDAKTFFVKNMTVFHPFTYRRFLSKLSNSLLLAINPTLATSSGASIDTLILGVPQQRT